MVVEFGGFTKGVIGKDLPADSSLENMKKADLIKLLHTAQHNYETLMWFYNNAVSANMNANNQKIISELENLKKCYNGDEDAVMYPMSFEAYIQKIIDLAKENCTSTDHNKQQKEVLSKEPSDIRLIDANALKSCYTGSNGMDDKASYESIRKMIDLQPTVIDSMMIREIEDLSLAAKMKAASLFCQPDYIADNVKRTVKESCDMQAFAYDKAVDIITRNMNIQQEVNLQEENIMTEKMYEELKKAVFDAGVNAIEDLLGCELEFDTDEDMFEAMDDVLDQMPEEDALNLYNKYCCIQYDER